ncbi:type II toxin-antitoxin system VapC family toxin [Candidatus Poriferisodalis sp.]|uniref:type II toxin-antitoxin system VapC family toxin n=1 Tax=Candidatus Poriferisodalis sp. TaxID=3101277 RepID=UPI003C6F233E
MTAFLDSSALVKRYADEPDSDLVQAVSEPVIASDLAAVEVPAALWRKHRIGEISATDAQNLCRRFLTDISASSPESDAVLIEVGKDILRSAIGLVARHPLRAYDAVQLASALAASRLIGRCPFGCFDEKLNNAAAAEGLLLLW